MLCQGADSYRFLLQMDILRLASDLAAQRRQHLISLEGEPGAVKLEFEFGKASLYPRRASAVVSARELMLGGLPCMLSIGH